MRVKIFSDSRFEEKTMPPIDNTRPPKLFPHDFAALSKDGSGTLRTDRTPVRERYEPAIHVSGSGFKGRVLNFFRSVAAAIARLDINADYDKPNLPGFADESSATYALLGGLSQMNVNQYDRPRN
jgi:hypothetical protein